MPPRRAPPPRFPLPVLGVRPRRRAAPRRVPEPVLPVRPQRPTAPSWVPMPVLSVRPFPLVIRKRKWDGFFPLLPPDVTTRNRKRCRFFLDRLRAHNKHEDLPASPLVSGWVGFSPEEVEILKAFHRKRSYYGGPDYKCARCHAVFWWRERVQSMSAITKRRVVYNLCCKGGKVLIPPFKKPPAFLNDLLDYTGPPQTLQFIKKIRQYNCLFAFTSMGAKIHRSINNGGGPNIFKINGQVCHRIGSLLPEEGDTPKYAELYIYDTQNEVENRIKALNNDDEPESGLSRPIVTGLMHMLDATNSFVKKFRMAREILKENKHAVVSVRIIAPGENDSPQFSLPTTDELAGLFVGELTVEAPYRDLIVHCRGPGLQRISSLDPSYMPLQYPLLFPYGERGFQLGVRYIGVDSSDMSKRVKMTMQDYYCFCSHYKAEQHNPYLCCGLLSSQARVDARACIDECRLRYLIKVQDDMRAEKLQLVVDAVGIGKLDGAEVGKKNIMPSAYTGGRRYMTENFHDAVAVSRVHGSPDIFTTFTCNPKWPEITESLEPGQKAVDRADITVRVYHMKLLEYLRKIRNGKAFGAVVAGTVPSAFSSLSSFFLAMCLIFPVFHLPSCFPVLHTVEFQKRGLPHAHILVWQEKDDDRVVTSTLINSFISAEIPDPVEDPLGYALVAEFMMHGPCGIDGPKCPCMKKGVCSKKIPKKFQDETSIDESGFPLYRRPDNGRFVMKNNIRLDNRHVVPYNMKQLKRFQAHINVEWCNKAYVIKYLYKYITKGPDNSKTLFQSVRQKGDDEVDEIEEYRECRYICDHSSDWRVYGFEIHSKTPSVERLPVHLHNMHIIRFRTQSALSSVANNTWLQKTMLTQWFVANRQHPSARHLTYCDFPTRWSWKEDTKTWVTRTRSDRIGRIYYVHPSTGELFYFRMLLMIVKGATCYADVRTYNGIVYSTFKEACAARGLLGDDMEWYTAFDEALKWGMGNQLRQLFVTMVVHCGINDENAFFEKYCAYLSDDIQYRMQSARQGSNYVVPPVRLRDMLLDELAALFAKNGSSILDYNLPAKSTYDGVPLQGDMVTDALDVDVVSLLAKAEAMYHKLNKDQLYAYESILERIRSDKPGFFFVSGYGGTGKTFLWNALDAYLRGHERVVLAVASSGVAALLLPMGRTAHSRFKIPIDLADNGTCDIKRSTMLSNLIESASLIIWDEALMSHRKCFEALDRSFRDVLSATDSSLADIPFGGKVVVLGGDLRQILPVIEGGTRGQIVGAAVTNSPLWNCIEVLHLTVNMCLAVQTSDPVMQAEVAAFAQWILSIGDGTAHAVTREGESSPSWITIPDELLIHAVDNIIDAIVQAVYVDLLARYSNPAYVRERAILTPTNETAEKINDHVLSLLPSVEREYLSYDSLGNSSDEGSKMDAFFPVEVLNKIKINNFPYHRLVLKVGVPIMLLRNLSQSTGLCNGTRLIVTKLANKVIEAVVITGSNEGDVVYIPRICLTSK
ncbi:hypothetical protein ACQJBY_049478 [Aegilops geniculata]